MPTKNLFDKFEITKDKDFLVQHQGKYPVIAVTFKDVKEASYEASVRKFTVLIKELYRQHGKLLENPNIPFL